MISTVVPPISRIYPVIVDGSLLFQCVKFVLYCNEEEKLQSAQTVIPQLAKLSVDRSVEVTAVAYLFLFYSSVS